VLRTNLRGDLIRFWIVATVSALAVLAACSRDGGVDRADNSEGRGRGEPGSSGPIEWVAPSIQGSSEVWTVDPTPEVSLGDEEWDPSRVFFRVAAGRILADRSFVIADGGSLELRFFGPDGRVVRVMGGRGSGPQEFLSLGLIEALGDSLLVYDRGNRRIAVLSSAGDLRGHIQVPPRSRLKGVFSDGSLLYGLVVPTPDRAGYRPLYETYHLRTPDGNDREVGRFPMVETYWVQVGGGAITDIGYPFGRVGLSAVWKESWYASRGIEFSIECYDQDGTLSALLSAPLRPARITGRDLDDFLQGKRSNGKPWRFEREARDIPIPETFPSYDRLLIDGDGAVWARTFSTDAGANRWHVFSAEPYRFSVAELPPSLIPLDIRKGRILGVETGSNEVEKVVLLRLGSGH